MRKNKRQNTNKTELTEKHYPDKNKQVKTNKKE